MSFYVFNPCDRLKPYVRRLLVQQSATSAPYTVLPDTSIVLGFQYKGRLALLKNDRERIGLSPAGVTGLRREYRTFSSTPETGSVLVYFTETGAARFFDFPLCELFDGSYSLRDIYRRTDVMSMEERLAGASDDVKRIAVVEDFLCSRLIERDEDRLVSAAVRAIKEKEGSVRIKELAEDLCISQSRFEKRFRNAVGISPKGFSSIARFQKAVRELSASTTLTEAAQRAGYFDQAHFIKDFRSFSGQTPERFLRTHAGQRQ